MRVGLRSAGLVTDMCDMPFRDSSLFVSSSVLVGEDRVCLASNRGAVGLLDLRDSLAVASEKMVRWETGTSVEMSAMGVSREVSALNYVEETEMLVTTAAHWVEQRNLETGVVTGLLSASSMTVNGKRIGWRNPRGKLQDTVMLDRNVFVVGGEENLLVCDFRCDMGRHVQMELNKAHGTKASPGKRAHSYCIRALATDQHRIFSGGGDGVVCLWDLAAKGCVLQKMEPGNFVVDVKVDMGNVFVSRLLGGGVEQYDKNDLAKRGQAFGRTEQSVLSFDVYCNSLVACYNTGSVELIKVEHKLASKSW